MSARILERLAAARAVVEPRSAVDAVTSQAMIPHVGQIAHLRARPYLVEEVTPDPGRATLVRLSCLDDDAPGWGT